MLNRPCPPIHATVVHLLRTTADEHPGREALVFADLRLSYRDYAAAVAGFAARLSAEAPGGSLRGRPVALLLPNGPEVCVATFAVLAAGACVVPLNPTYTVHELGPILADAEPALIVHDAALGETVRRAIGERPIPCLAIQPAGQEVRGWAAAGAAWPEPMPAPRDIAFVQYTGGTTGRSKGVVLSHGAVSVNVSQREWALPTGRGGERILCAMPLFHSYALAMGLFLSAYCAGALHVLPRYHPTEVLRAIGSERITIFPGSPTIFTGLMGHDAFPASDFSSVHTCYSGSAALPEAVLTRWELCTGSPIFEGYGQTECGPVLTYNAVGLPRRPGSVGVPLWGTEVEVVDVEGGTRVLPPGELGEIRARGPQLMTRYHRLPDETRDTLRDGWVHTGDIGEFDADGYLYIRDRKKEMAIVGGYNVYPREVEDAILADPAVAEVAVVGAPDAYRGERLHAFVVLRAGAVPDAERLLAHCASRLARYKVPAAIGFVDALPKTPVNKTDKKALRERARSLAAGGLSATAPPAG